MPPTTPRITAVTASLAALALTACSAYTSPAPVNYSQADMADYILAAVLSPARPAEDVAQDGVRRPEETVAFAGVRRGDVIAQVAPGDGYYTRILSQTVGEEGKIFALVPAGQAQQPGAFANLNEIAEQYGNIEVVVIDAIDAASFPQPVDLVWAVNVQDMIEGGNARTIGAWAAGALKTGGVYFVQDSADVRGDVAAAGLSLEAEASGSSDNFTLRFRKPA